MGPLGLSLISSSVTYRIGDSDVDSDSHGHFAVRRWAAFWGWVSCVCLGYWISYVRFYDHWILCANLLLWVTFLGHLGLGSYIGYRGLCMPHVDLLCTVEYLISSGILWLLDITMWIFFSGSPMRDTWSHLRCGILWTLDSGCESSALGLPCEILGLLWDHLGGSTCLKWWHSDQRISWHIGRRSS